MIFQITNNPQHIAGERVDLFEWALVKSDGEVLARGPRVFYDEASCRSQIAAAKKSMKGAMRCKVQVVE